MLSKSQAKLFFIIFTVGFSGVFLWLTVDTIRQIPNRSNGRLLDERVVRGKHIWEDNNCMGCHTILGEGAYYAPELTKVIERRGEVWIRTFIKDPEAMYPGKRKMVKYDFSDAQIDDLLAFFRWVGEVDTNGFPAKPDLAAAQPPQAAPAALASAAASPAPKIYTALCQACHSVGGQGGKVGPALDGIGGRKDAQWLRAWLKDPQAIKPGTTMPKLPLADQDLDALVQWLGGLK